MTQPSSKFIDFNSSVSINDYTFKNILVVREVHQKAVEFDGTIISFGGRATLIASVQFFDLYYLISRALVYIGDFMQLLKRSGFK